MAFTSDDILKRRIAEPGRVYVAGSGNFYEAYGKRLLDIAVVLIFAPLVILVLILAIMLIRRDGGPGLFGHERIGYGRRRFTCWKIRTMVTDPEDLFQAHIASSATAAREWQERQKLTNDPRITRFGRLLRRTSFDELPQLWNVLIGEMSLVGPRPFTPDQMTAYESYGPDTPYYRAMPGITGLWQVGPRHHSEFAARARYDREYLQNVGFMADLAILARTVLVVLRLRGQ